MTLPEPVSDTCPGGEKRGWKFLYARTDAGDWPDDRFGDPQFDTVFPYDEIRAVWWNGSLYEKSPGGNPISVNGPLVWLLPYWALRYGGVISE